MAVVAHAEDDDIGGKRQIGDARACGGEFLVRGQAESASGVKGAAAARLRSSVSRTSRALERGLSSATRRSSARVMATRVQSSVTFDSAVEIMGRRLAAGDDQQRHAPRLDGVAQTLRCPVAPALGASVFAVRRIRGAAIAFIASSGHSYSSFQVRPSRSISATEALGPQVPAA